MNKVDHCQNPWKPNCNSEDIKLLIRVNGENLPICRACWEKIADSDKQWGPNTQTEL